MWFDKFMLYFLFSTPFSRFSFLLNRNLCGLFCDFRVFHKEVQFAWMSAVEIHLLRVSVTVLNEFSIKIPVEIDVDFVNIDREIFLFESLIERPLNFSPLAAIFIHRSWVIRRNLNTFQKLISFLFIFTKKNVYWACADPIYAGL